MDVTVDNGLNWTSAEVVGPSSGDTVGGWIYHEFTLSSVSLAPTATVKVRFIAQDQPAGSLVEAAVDDFTGLGVNCQSCPTIAVNPASLPSGTINQLYSQAVSASGGTGPYTFAVTAGGLPNGLGLSGGTLSGTPSGPAGPSTFTITATDTANSCAGSREYSIVVVCPIISLAPGTLPTTIIGRAYNRTITATGGSGAYTFAVTAGGLPPGLTLSPAGNITGTSTAGGTYHFTVTATDASGCTGSLAYSIFVRFKFVEPI